MMRRTRWGTGPRAVFARLLCLFAPLVLTATYLSAAGSPDAGPARSSLADADERTPAGREEELHEDPARRAGQWWRDHWRDHESVRLDALLRAAEKVSEMREGPRDAGIGAWTPVGPGNIGGRIRAILIHPTNANRLWVGGVSGGIWTTTNGGSSWSAVNDFLPNLAVSSLVLDPTNTNILYAGTGEFFVADGLPGAGILKSTDGGVTWNQLSSTNNAEFTYVGRLAHSPTAANVLYAAVPWARKVKKSSDGGSTWTDALTAADAAPTDIKIDPANASRILVGCLPWPGTTGEVYYSSNAGASWSNETIGGSGNLPDDTQRAEVAWGAASTMFASLARNGGELWRSTDLGATWQLRNTGTDYLTQPNYANALWADPTNANYVLVGGLDLWRSTNGGSTFTRISDWATYHTGTSAHADHHLMAAASGFNGSTNLTVYFANDGGIQRAVNYRTVAQHTGWTNLANNLAITQFYGGAAAADGSILLGGTQDNSTLRWTSGSGTTWWQGATGDGGRTAIDFASSLIQYAVSPPLYVGKSTNGGDSFFPANSGLADTTNAAWTAPLVLDPNNANILWCAGQSIFRSTNKAGSWSSRRGPLGSGSICRSLAVKPGNSNEIWAGYEDGTISVSTNAGVSWSNVNNGTPARTVTWIAPSPFFAGEAIATFSGYNTDNVWITENFGAGWTQRTGMTPDDLPAIQVNTATYHPADPDWIYVGTDIGVFASDDFGAHWSVDPHAVTNEGPANVEVDQLFWYGSTLVAATHGRGMFYSTPVRTVYVDWTNGGAEDGSQAHPFNTVGEGIAASAPSTSLIISTGTYTEGANLFDRRGLVTATGGSVTVR